MADVNISPGLQDEVWQFRISEEENLITQLRKCNATSDPKKMKDCFNSFDKDGDGGLNRSEFSYLLKCLFIRDDTPYRLSEKQEEDIFKLFDDDKDGKISLEEFKVCWYHWMKQIIDPVSALIIVDVQNDFISGTLALKNCSAHQDGLEVVPVINKLIEESNFDLIVYSLDWHPASHISFIENVDQREIHHTSKVNADSARKMDTVVFAGPPVLEQIMWPSHCVQHSKGSDLHPDLKIVEKNCIYVKKGTNADVDSYSAFWDNNKMGQTELVSMLSQHKITDCYVVGLAYDVCVGATSLHSLEHGFRTVLVEDACRGVSVEGIASTKTKLKRQGAAIIHSDQVPGMTAVTDRRPELGYQAALNVAMAKRLVKESENKDK